MSAQPDIKFDLTGPEFAAANKVRIWTHTASDFPQLLKKVNWETEWAEIWNESLRRYALAPSRPHCVTESFLRGKYGYAAMIIRATTPEGKAEVRGLLYRCVMNLDCPPQARKRALDDLGDSAVTQWLAQATGDPGYIIKWDRPNN